MNEHQQNLRIAAARDFMESLNQLENILAPEYQAAESEYQPEDAFSAKEQANSEILEQMAADLDAFFGDASDSTS
ncbi:MAG: hypothetical protein AB1589_16505 [Cyanobacteriota bacterium]